MKKTYIIPETDVVLVAPATLIAESLPKSDEPVDPEDFEVKEDFGGSRNSIWGDNDWDE